MATKKRAQYVSYPIVLRLVRYTNSHGVRFSVQERLHAANFGGGLSYVGKRHGVRSSEWSCVSGSMDEMTAALETIVA